MAAAIATPATAATAVAAIPMTTQFTGASACKKSHLTMVGMLQDEVWLNEPFPASGLTSSDCYPSEVLASLAAVTEATTTTIVPLFSPLICPDWYTTVSHWPGNYIACCPDSYTLHLTTGPTPEARTAYNATCYSNLISQTSVTAYDSVTITSTQGYNVPTAQAYAHVIEGFVPVTGRGAPLTVAAGSPASITNDPGSPASEPPFTDSPSSIASADERVGSQNGGSKLGAGAIAGIMLGAVILNVLIGLMAWIIFLLRRRRSQDDSAMRSQTQTLHPVSQSTSSSSVPTISSLSMGTRLSSVPPLTIDTRPPLKLQRSQPSQRTTGRAMDIVLPQGGRQHPARENRHFASAANDEALYSPPTPTDPSNARTNLNAREAHNKACEPCADDDAASSIADFRRPSPSSVHGYWAPSASIAQPPPPRFSHVIAQDRQRQRDQALAEMEGRPVQRAELDGANVTRAAARLKEDSRPSRAIAELPGDREWRRK